MAQKSSPIPWKSLCPFTDRPRTAIPTPTYILQRCRVMSTAPKPTPPKPPAYLTRIPISHHPQPITIQTPPTPATQVLYSLQTNTQIPRLQTTFPSLFPLPTRDAYQLTHSILLQRLSANEHPVGRKIGFTNRSIWPEYNIDKANWSYMYDSTVLDVARAPSTVSLAALSNLEPRIEPELVLGISRAKRPEVGMGDGELLACVEWVAPAFEVVVSPWRGWVFGSEETTVGFALHGRLCLGQRVEVGEGLDVGVLERFEVELLREGEVVDRGVGRNVLGGPIQALRHLVELLDEDKLNPGVGCGEIVTTGTLTRALPINRVEGGERWEMRVSGLEGVEGVDCRFVY